MARNKKNINHVKLFRFGFLLVALLVLGVVAMTGAFANKPDSSATAAEAIVLPGTVVQGVDLSNLTREQGLEQLAQLEQRLQQTRVDVVFRGATHNFTLGALGCTVDADQTMDRVLSATETTGSLQRWWANLRPVPKKWEAVLKLDREQTKASLEEVAGSLYVPAVKASLKVDNQDRVYVEPSSPGYRADLDIFYAELIKLANSDHGQKEQVFSLELPVIEIQPALSTEEVQKWEITRLLSRYTTYFNPGLLGRTNNIKIATGILDGLVIAPGEVVSFNGVVGPRGADRGYQNAGIIVGNKVEDGLGGGICQVATTLYNTVLLADLDIVQRANHSIAITYAPIGLDAAVAYGSLDFRFKNSTGHHLLLKTSVAGNSLTMKIFGHEQEKKSVNLSSWVVETIQPKVIYKVDPNLEPETTQVVQKSAPGYRVQAQRVVVVDGKEVKREMLLPSYYLPVEQIIAVQSPEQIPGQEPKDPGADPEPTPDQPDADTSADPADGANGNPPAMPSGNSGNSGNNEGSAGGND